MDDRHNEVLAVAALFFVITWVTVSLRCYVRGVMMKTWGEDDYYMVATLVGSTICTTPCKILISPHRWPLLFTWPFRLSLQFTAREDTEANCRTRTRKPR
jgi:hypothetical protein